MRITQKAKKELTRIKFLRIGITTKGCNGKSYEFSTSQQPSDNILSINGFTLYVAKEISRLWLLEDDTIILDYKDETFFKGFEIVNPKEFSRCGCGKSFYL